MGEEISLKILRDQLESLQEPSVSCKKFEDASLIADKELQKNLSFSYASLPLKIRLTNSKIKETDEIKEKLEILCYHLSLLRNTTLTKDYKTAKKTIHKLFRDELTSMKVVISDIENFKKYIEELDIDLQKLLSATLPLDYKLTLEKEHKRHISGLKDAYAGHMSTLRNIGTLFLQLNKYIFNDSEFRTYLSKEMQDITIPQLAVINA